MAFWWDISSHIKNPRDRYRGLRIHKNSHHKPTSVEESHQVLFFIFGRIHKKLFFISLQKMRFENCLIRFISKKYYLFIFGIRSFTLSSCLAWLKSDCAALAIEIEVRESGRARSSDAKFPVAANP